ncbi:MAG: leucine-rich repeat protein [Clostridia bacterium]|nr:leucine-rich repeat protein [Clostridia bacterium]
MKTGTRRNRIIRIVLFTVTALVLLFALLSCSSSNDDNSPTTPSSPSSSSSHIHTEVILEAREATCTEAGLTQGKKCSVCGEILLEQKETPYGHTEEIIEAVSPTCTSVGNTEGKKCSVCQEVLVQPIALPAEHKIQIIPSVAPTCTESGSSMGKKCSVCKEILLEPVEISPRHSIELIPEREATCTEYGSTEGEKCTVCGTVTIEPQPIPPSHKFENGVCTACGESEGSQGLLMELSEDKEYYIVAGIGSCEDTVIKIPESYDGVAVKRIKTGAFTNLQIEELIIPKSIERIGQGAFAECKSLKKVTLGRGVKTFKRGAFHGCTAIEDFYIESLSDWCRSNLEPEESSPMYYAKNIYANGELIKDLVIPRDIYQVNAFTFYRGNYAFDSIYIPCNITTVGNTSFSRAYSTLHDIIAKCELSSIPVSWSSGSGIRTFEWSCNNITTNELYDYVIVDGCAYLTNYKGNEEAVAVPSVIDGYSVLSIGMAFSGKNIVSISIPNGVRVDTGNSFAGCTRLAAIAVEEDNPLYTAIDGSLYSKDKTELIRFATSETSISFVIPSFVKVIGMGAFTSASAGSVVIPETVEELGDRCFCKTNVECVYFISTTPPKVGSNTFGYSWRIMIVPSEAYETYRDVDDFWWETGFSASTYTP